MDFHRRVSEFKLFWEEVSLIKLAFFLLGCGSAVSFTFYALFWQSPAKFPKETFVHIGNGRGLSSVADELENKHIVLSSFWFKVFVVLSGGSKGVLAGDYAFPQPENVFSVAGRITSADFLLEPIRVTIPEGYSVVEIGSTLEKVLPFFNRKDFLTKARTKEGYLFPDTYSFLPNVTAEQVIAVMEKNFMRNQRLLKEDFARSKYTLKDVVIMASLVEEEARTTETRRIIAGILWKRLVKNMPLQVDAVFPYINGKNTYQLTLDDLAIDSPYNTYKYKGLPIGPISNPGFDSLKSALTPITTPYLFYLSDRQGNMYYGKTFDEHLVNKEKYL